MTDRLEQIRRSHASARPKHDNPAWLHTHNDLTIVLAELDKSVLKLPSWRNVATDPPQLGKYVLCYFVGGHACSCAYAQETYDSEPRWYSDFGARMGQLPTHWMPLPEAPK